MKIDQPSIRTKLVILIGIVAATAIVALSSIYFYYLRENQKKLLAHQIDSTAELFTYFVNRPLNFGDSVAVDSMVYNLRTVPEVVAACVYDSTGFIFSRLDKEQIGYDFPLHPEEIEQGFSEEYYVKVAPIHFKGKQFGYFCVVASLQVFSADFWEQSYQIGSFSFFVLIISIGMAYRLQSSISQPLERLTEASKLISEKNDFSFRLQDNALQREDEIGVLYRQFNEMLSQIETREKHERQSKEALVKNEIKYRNLYQNSLVGLFRQNVITGEIMETNNKTREIFGFSGYEEFSSLRNLFVSPDDQQKLFDALRRNKELNKYELEMRTKTGEPIFVLYSGRFFEETNEAEGVFQDITENKINYNKLKKANDELDTFIYHASHDLRSPLRSVIGLVETAKFETDTGFLQEFYFPKISKSISKLDNLVQDLLAISRDNRTETECMEIDFEEEVNSCFDNLAYMPNASKVKKNIYIDQPNIFYSDRTRVSFVIANLVSNAIKYQRKEEENPYVTIRINVLPEKALIEIEDNGEGIPKDAHKRVFDMFRRESEAAEGSGLGLYIVKNAVEKLKGRIWLESEMGRGSIFTVEVPDMKYNT